MKQAKVLSCGNLPIDAFVQEEQNQVHFLSTIYMTFHALVRMSILLVENFFKFLKVYVFNLSKRSFVLQEVVLFGFIHMTGFHQTLLE